MERRNRDIGIVYGSKGYMAVTSNDRALTVKQSADTHAIVLPRPVSNWRNKFVTFYKKAMAEKTIAWIMVKTFWYCLYPLAIWDNWGNWKSTALLIAAALLYIAKFAKHIFDAIEGCENFVERRRHKNRYKKKYPRKNKSDVEEV